MKANTFDVIRCRTEIEYKKRSEIKSGCALYDPDPSSLGSYPSLDDAKKELKKYKPECRFYSGTIPYFLVTEYFVDCYEADENGEFVDGGDYHQAYSFIFDEELNDIVIEE